MLNVIGKVKVCQLEEKGKVVQGSAYWGVKDKNDEWETEFMQIVFVGDSVKQLEELDIKNKDYVFIEQAILRNTTVKKEGKFMLYPKVVVFKVGEVVEEVQEPTTTAKKGRFDK